MFIVGILLSVKKVAEMDRYHMLRVVVVTSILSFFVILFFLAYGFTLGNPIQFTCTGD